MGATVNNRVDRRAQNASHDNPYVLHSRPLRAEATIADTAQFDDPAWPLTPATLQGQGRGLTLDFETAPAQHRQALKALSYALLSGPLPPDERRPSISSVVSIFYNVRVFLRWLDANHPDTVLATVSEDTLSNYQRHLLENHRSHTRRQTLRASVVFMWRFRRNLALDGLRLDPRTVSGWFEPRSQTRVLSENARARIPEGVHSRLLVWALRFVDDFSDDILEAANRWDTLRGRRPAAPWGTVREMVTSYLDDARATGRPLPGFDGQVSYNSLARLIGCHRASLEEHVAAIAFTAAITGISEYAYLNLDVAGVIDERPWIKGVALDPMRDDSLTVLTQMLQAACYIVIAFLSGMRDSEVKHLRTGCCSGEADREGNIYRWKVASIAFKGEDSDAGTPATWIVGAAAARAIAVLERVQRERAGDRTDWLFASIKSGSNTGSAGRGGNEAMTLASTNRQINRFVSWVDAYCTEHSRDDSIPQINGSQWNLTTGQFRRTLAWYIARRPGGSIAGAIAYRHQSIQMFEGYAGTSASGFRAEVEAEEALARGENLLAMIDLNEHTRLTGPAADEAERRLGDMGSNPTFAGTVTTDRKRFLRLIEVHAPAIYPGKYSTCVYDPDKAQCLKKAGVDSATPELANCKPLTCRCVALTGENVQTWQDELAAIEKDLATGPLLPPLLAMRLKGRRDKVAHFLNLHGDTL
jgi:integrase